MSIMLFCSVFDRFWQLNYAARMNLVNFKSTTVIDVIDRPWNHVFGLRLEDQKHRQLAPKRDGISDPRTSLGHVQHVFS